MKTTSCGLKTPTEEGDPLNVLLSVLQLVDVDNDVTIHELAQTIIDIVGFRCQAEV